MKHNRRSWISRISLVLAGLGLAKLNSFANITGLHSFRSPVDNPGSKIPLSTTLQSASMKLGAFSVSLNVKDLKVSKAFYENLGFSAFGGDLAKNYLIMKNGNALIGLFHGMFDKTILTFNPGWDENAQKVADFEDVRQIQKSLKAKGISFTSEADEKTTGPAGFFIMDPDGNQILVDQHV